jgi:hypothetical protein
MAIDRPTQRASLRNAELRLVLLLEDLERTVHSAEQLANAGLEEEAIRVIDLQREALARIPEQIASEVAVPNRRPVRRLVLTAAAAFLTVAASVAAAVSVVGPQPAPAEEVVGFLDTAGTMSDPADRLASIESALNALREVPKADPARGELAERIASEARKTSDEVSSDPGGDRRLITRARDLADRAEESAPPPPSTSQSPLEGLLPEA